MRRLQTSLAYRSREDGAPRSCAAASVCAQQRAMLASASYRSHDRHERSIVMIGDPRRCPSPATVRLNGDGANALQIP